MPSTPAVLLRLEQAWFQASIAEFIEMPSAEIVGRLANCEQFSVGALQIDAWNTEIAILKYSLAGLAGHVLFEFNIPRIGRRIDTVVICDALVFVIEFKVGADSYDRSAFAQVWDYAICFISVSDGIGPDGIRTSRNPAASTALVLR